MRTTLRTWTLAASAVLAGLGFLGETPAQAQNGTYQDFPYQQGSLGYNYYRSAAKSSRPSYNRWGRFGRRRAAARQVTPPPVYRPAARTYAAPTVPATPYYYDPRR